MSVPASVLDRSRVENQSEQKQEPTWLRELRLQAWQAYEDFEEWPKLWKTDLSRFKVERLSPYTPVQPRSLDELPAELAETADTREDAAALLIHDHTGVVYADVDEALTKQGVILCSLDEAVREHEDLVRKYFATEAAPVDLDRFAALNAALWSGGVFLYVPKDVELELPIQAQYWLSGAGAALFDRTLIIADRNSKVVFVDGYASESDVDDPSYHFGVVEIYAEDGANVTFASIQNFGENVWNFTTRRAVLGRDARVDWALGDFGARLSRTGFHSLLKGSGSESFSNCVFFASGKQHHDIATTMQHLGSNSHSDMLARGVSKDQGKSVYTGMTDIDKGARETSAFQTEHTLILNQGAHADAIPGLLIDEHDLEGAGHAATVGWIDQEQLFYLRARGLPEQLAVRMIVEGFFAPLVERIPLPSIRESLQSMVAKKLG